MIAQSQIKSRKQELMVSVSVTVFYRFLEKVGSACIFTYFLNVLPSGMDFPVRTVRVMEEDIESMHVEASPDNQSGANGPFPPLSADSEHQVDSFAMDSWFPTSHIVEPAPWPCTNSYAYL